ncbi:MAG: serine/threonine-protein kinase [Polyangiales bacterium]
MSTHRCRVCAREFLEGEQFCPQDGTRLAASESDTESDGGQQPLDSLVGSTLDARYRVLRVIGEGGMGVVYEALHVLIEKRVAIKVLRDTYTGRVDVVERFRQEAKSASKIGHPNIVDVSDFGETPTGQSYIVMEMLTGEDLADVLARVRVLSPARAVRIVYQVARALHATHKKSIVHRDLKPENIYLVERDGVQDFVKVVDFGVAKMSSLDTMPGRKLTRTGMLFGTPEYMSPEQALGKPFDHRVDVYALGAILFELLTGRVPFTGENFMGILAQHGNAPLPTLRSVNAAVSVSPELEGIVMRALAKNPSDRYASMGELADDLRNVPEMPTHASAQTPAAPLWSLADHYAVRPDSTGHNHDVALEQSHHAQHAHQAHANHHAGHMTTNTPPQVFPMPVRAITPSPMPSLPIRQHLLSDAYAQDALMVQPGVALTRSLKVGMFAAILASGLLAALVAQRVNTSKLLASGGRSSVTSVPEIAPQSMAAETIMVRSEPQAAPQPAPEPVAPPAPTVEVQVRTRPLGASVSALGTDARCSAAPCALAVPRGKPVTLRAETASASVERTWTFDDKTEVELHVNGGRKAGANTRTPNDLKVPSIFR